MTLNRSLKGEFGAVAEKYDFARPRYPEDMIEDIVKAADLNKDSQVLDVGCGTGIATLPFARRGYRVVGIDIGPKLLEVARRKSAHLSNVVYQEVSFEDADYRNEFDLIISGQAFHWMDPKIAFKKSAEMLKPGGVMALFWNLRDFESSEFLKSLRQSYMELCKNYPRGAIGTFIDSVKENALKPGSFATYNEREYWHTIKFSHDDFKKYVFSMSWVVSSEQDIQKQLLERIETVLKHQENPVPVKFRTRLIILGK